MRRHLARRQRSLRRRSPRSGCLPRRRADRGAYVEPTPLGDRCRSDPRAVPKRRGDRRAASPPTSGEHRPVTSALPPLRGVLGARRTRAAQPRLRGCRTHRMKGLVLVGVVALLALGVSASAGGETPAACPIQIPNTLTTPNQAARGALVPTGARSLLLCDYGGLNAGSNSGRLAASVAVSNASLIELLARSFDTLRASRGVFHCPMDDGSEITATFAYPVAAADVVRVDLTGCQTVTNGKVIKSAASAKGQALIARLQRIAEPAGGAAPC